MGNAKVEFVDDGNLMEAIAYFQTHEESCQFLINNLKTYGAKLTDHHNSGNYKIIRDGSRVKGAFCLTRRGNLLAQTDLDFTDLILRSCSEETVPLKGFIGGWRTIEPLWHSYKILFWRLARIGSPVLRTEENPIGLINVTTSTPWLIKHPTD